MRTIWHNLLNPGDLRDIRLVALDIGYFYSAKEICKGQDEGDPGESS